MHKNQQKYRHYFKVRHNLNNDTVLLLYRSFIQPYLDYCNIIWATGHSNNLERLFRKQKKSSCYYITKWNAHTIPLFKQLNILTVYDINKLQTLCFVYKQVTIPDILILF